MDCCAEYPHVQDRMKKLNQSRLAFKALMHFFADQPRPSQGRGISSSGTENQEQDVALAAYFDELIERMNYHISYCYHKSVHFQSCLYDFCRLLDRLGKCEQACHYGQYHDVDWAPEMSGTTTKHSLAKLESSVFWFQLYASYVRQYGGGSKSNSSKNKLLPIAHELMAVHLNAIQKCALKLVRHYEQSKVGECDQSKDKADQDESCTQELIERNILGIKSISDKHSSGNNNNSVHSVLMKLLHLFCTQYRMQLTTGDEQPQQ